MGQRIDVMWAYLAVDPVDGCEGLIAEMAPNGMWMPMVGADLMRMESLREQAKATARATGNTVRLVRFSVREDREVYKPDDPVI